MSKFLLPLAAFTLLAIVLAVGVHRSPEKGTIQSPLIGKPAPPLDLPSLTGSEHLAGSPELRGRAYLLNVWATWCAGCRTEHAVLLEVQRSGIVPIVGFNWKDDDAQALAWLSDLGNPYETVLVDHEGRTAIDWGVYGAPETFLIDAAGIVTHKHVGPLTREIWARDFVPRLRASQASAP